MRQRVGIGQVRELDATSAPTGIRRILTGAIRRGPSRTPVFLPALPPPIIFPAEGLSSSGRPDTLEAMRVEVHLHAELARLAPEQRGVVKLDIPDGTRVGDVLQRFPLSKEQRVIVGVNGATAPLDQELVEGARIDLLTPMAGGSPARRH